MRSARSTRHAVASERDHARLGDSSARRDVSKRADLWRRVAKRGDQISIA
jgi:hypothetical protein